MQSRKAKINWGFLETKVQKMTQKHIYIYAEAEGQFTIYITYQIGW